MSDFIPEDFIQKVLEDSDIVSLVDSYVPLKRKGKDHWAQCPFCDDGSNPSFSVSEQKQFYYCFKCRASGNAIGFLMNYQSKDFVGAVEILAKNLGLEIPRTKSNYDREKFDELFRFNDEAKNFYKNNLLKPKEGEHIRSYLKERGISEEISKEFELGLSLEGWDNLVKHFESKKIEAKESSKLFKIAKNERKYDVFRNRLIFPIVSRRNKIVGFGGRVLDDQDQPKYLNTPESEVFKKSRELYGLPNVLARSSRPSQILVVEGYMDVLACFSFDLPIAVATLGIATNKFHLETLFQKTDEVIFCFDGDEAGRNASKLALEIAIPVVKDGKRVKFLFLPDDHDPASLLLEKGKDELPKLISDAKNLSEYLFESILEKHDSSLEGKAAASKEFVSLVKPMQEGNFKTILINEFSKKMDIDLSEVSPTKPKAKKHSQTEETEIELSKVTKSLLKCIIHNPDLAKSEYLDYFIDNNEFLISPLISFLRAKTDVSFPMIIQEFPEQKNILIDLSNDQNLISPDEGLKFIKQAVDYIERNQGDNLLKKLKIKYEKNELDSKEKIELKKLLTSKFEHLTEDELSLFKKL